jgi:spermidine synthase
MQRKMLIYLAPPFFFSGFSALLYQLIWLRTLFGFYGLTYDAVTIIVASFMLGLGIGSLFGGKLAQQEGCRPIFYFLCLELGIGFFGFFSLSFFHWISDLTLYLDNIQLFLLSTLLFSFPTLLMGATLPLLIGYCSRHMENTGLRVGLLYSINTLGAACACFAAAFFLMNWLGQSKTVWLASIINWLNALWVLCLIPGLMRSNPPEKKPTLTKSAKQPWLILLLSALSGYLALSCEIIWLRIYSYAGKTVFYSVTLLGMYLIGLALGSFLSGHYCTWVSKRKTQFLTLAWVYITVGVLIFSILPLISYITMDNEIMITMVFPAIVTLFFGFAFPLLHCCTHASSQNDENSFSYFYLANIIGSTAGVIITGFFLLDHFSTEWVNTGLSILGILMGALTLWAIPTVPRQTMFRISSTLICLIGCFIWIKPTLYKQMYEHLLHMSEPFTHLVENKSGVVAVTQSKAVYGHGLYDGYYNVNLHDDKNGIIRAYAISAYVQNPENVLMIGLSSGSWAQVLANHPQVKHLTIIEINPSYIQLIKQYPEVKSLLINPKVDIVIDDGRRWLRRNPQAQFDLIVMNTTWYWREYTSYLLSVEFLELARHALKPNGFLTYNLTGSNNALHTALSSFKHALRVKNFIALSDRAIQLNSNRLRSVLETYHINGQLVVDKNNPEDQALLNTLAHKAQLANQESSPPWSSLFETEEGLSNPKRYPYQRIVTDDNMGDEWE